MRQSLHISQVRRILDRGDRVSLLIVKKNGSLMRAVDVVSLSYDIYAGTRTIKYMRSGEKRTIHDVQIIAINDYDVFI